jgi:hypothetical protein
MTWVFSLLLVLLFPQQAAPQQVPARPKLEVPKQQVPEILPPGQPQVVSSLAFNGAEFINSFNASADRARIVTILAPT